MTAESQIHHDATNTNEHKNGTKAFWWPPDSPDEWTQTGPKRSQAMGWCHMILPGGQSSITPAVLNGVYGGGNVFKITQYPNSQKTSNSCKKWTITSMFHVM